MGSMSSPNSWPPYYSFKDCSQGVCSIYCPQWCYILFPPPPPLSPKYGSGINFSPLIIAIIGILASAFLLVTYYTIIAKYCRRRTGNIDQNQVFDFENQVNHDQYQISSSGLDESLIKSITVCKYIKGDGLIEGTECSICLGEFQEDESLKLLPKCNHSFHILCIDTWLKSHSNCPLCRANVISNNPPQNTQNSSNLAISSLQIHRESDLVFVVDVGERQNVINVENQEQGEESFGKLISDGSNSCGGNLLVADILRIRDDDEEIEVGIEQISSGIGSSGGIRGENLMKNGGNEEMDLGRRDELKRCSSTAGPRLWQEKGKNCITPS